MNNEWIIEVLRDLASFAEGNEMPKSYATLVDAMVVVSAEDFSLSFDRESRALLETNDIRVPITLHS